MSDPYQNVSFLPFVNMMRNEAWPADSLLDYYDTFIRSKIQATPFKFQFDYPFTVLMAKWPKVNPLSLQRQAPPTAYYFQVCVFDCMLMAVYIFPPECARDVWKCVPNDDGVFI